MKEEPLETMVKELKALLPFKDTTDIGDIILVVAKNPQILQYGVVTDIIKDDSRKDEWWHMSFSFLAIPLQEATWTLRTEQMTGQEIFTMGGEERFIKSIDVGKRPSPSVEDINEIVKLKSKGSKKGSSKITPIKKKTGLRRVK